MTRQFLKLTALIRPWTLWLGIACAAAVLVNLLEMAVPLQLRFLVNETLGKDRLTSVPVRGLVALAVLLVVTQILKIGQRLSTEWPATRIGADLFQHGVHHLLSYPLSWFAMNHSGALQVRLERSTRAVADIVKTGISDILSPLIGLVMCFALIWQASQMVGLVASITIPLLAFITVWQAKSQSGIRITINQAREEQGVRVAEAVMGIEQVKLFRAEQVEAARAGVVSLALANQEFAHHRAMARFDLFKFWIERAGFTAVLICSILTAWRPSSTLGAGGVLMLVLLYERIADTTRHLHRIIDETNEKWILAQDYLRILDIEPVMRRSDVVSNGYAPDLTCENVTFRYSDLDKAILKEVCFRAAWGSKIAIVGQSGSGKSTLARLLVGMHKPSAGRITVGQSEIKPIEQAASTTIGMLSQEIYIFAGTVAENIRYGSWNANDDDVRRVSAIAGLAEFIEDLEKQYQTKLGQRGNGLSGGQKQRLALARVLLQDPDIVIFDEPIASLDPENARRFFDIVLRVFQDKTVVIITHDLTNVHWADKIVMLENGRISEVGSPQELGEGNTAFSRLRDGCGVPASQIGRRRCRLVPGNSTWSTYFTPS